MAGSIARDSYSQGPQNTATSWSWSHTCSGLNRLLVVVGHQTDSVTTVTYNGIPLTLAKAQSSGSTGLKIWYLLNPPVGTYTITVNSSISTYIRFSSISYTGVHQLAPINTTAGNTAGGTGITADLTSTIANCWAVCCLVGSGTVSGFTKIPSTAAFLGNIGGDGQCGILDSNQSFPTGAFSIGESGGGSTTWTIAGVAIRPLDQPGGILLSSH